MGKPRDPLKVEGLDEEDLALIDQVGVDLARYDTEADLEHSEATQGEETPGDSTEEEETPQTEETSSSKFMEFESKQQLDDFIEERLKGRLERERRKSEEAEKRAAREAEKKALENQQEFEKLYNSEKERTAELEERVQALEGFEEQYNASKTTISNLADTRMAELKIPTGVRKMLTERFTEQERLDWLSEPENVSEFGGATETIDPSPGGDETPSPEADEKAKAEFAQAEAAKF